MVMKAIEGSDFAEVILGMKNPSVAIVKSYAVVNEVHLNRIK